MRAKAFKRRQSALDETSLLFFSAIFGIGLIFLLPKFGVQQWIKSVLVASIVCGYAIIVWIRKHNDVLSMEKASDNAYYLGLIFTLLSLFRTLIFFDETETSLRISIVSDFATALLSTIAGVICRTMLQQMSNDPGDVELAARQELSKSLNQLRHRLADFLQYTNVLNSVTRTTFEEISENTRSSLEETSRHASMQMKRVAEEMTALADSYKQIVEAPQLLENNLSNLVASTEEFGNATREITQIQRQFNEQMAHTSTEVKEIIESLKFDKQILKADEAIQSLAKLSKGFSDLKDRLETSAQSTDASVDAAYNAAVKVEESATQIASMSKRLDDTSNKMDGQLQIASTAVGLFSDQLAKSTGDLRQATREQGRVDQGDDTA